MHWSIITNAPVGSHIFMPQRILIPLMLVHSNILVYYVYSTIYVYHSMFCNCVFIFDFMNLTLFTLISMLIIYILCFSFLLPYCLFSTCFHFIWSHFCCCVPNRYHQYYIITSPNQTDIQTQTHKRTYSSPHLLHTSMSTMQNIRIDGCEHWLYSRSPASPTWQEEEHVNGPGHSGLTNNHTKPNSYLDGIDTRSLSIDPMDNIKPNTNQQQQQQQYMYSEHSGSLDDNNKTLIADDMHKQQLQLQHQDNGKEHSVADFDPDGNTETETKSVSSIKSNGSNSQDMRYVICMHIYTFILIRLQTQITEENCISMT